MGIRAFFCNCSGECFQNVMFFQCTLLHFPPIYPYKHGRKPLRAQEKGCRKISRNIKYFLCNQAPMINFVLEVKGHTVGLGARVHLASINRRDLRGTKDPVPRRKHSIMTQKKVVNKRPGL